MSENLRKITVYDAGNTSRVSASAWREMFSELWEYRELIHRLLLRNIFSQFRQSFLGFLWVALPPVATTIVFTLLRKADIVNVPMKDIAMPYAIFALLGTTIWQYFTQVTMMSTASIASSGSLVSKIYFPREVLVVSASGQATVNLAIRSCVVLLTFVLFAYQPCWEALLIIPILVPLTALALGLGFIFAPINTMMHDMSRMLQFLFQFGMFLAPTVYPTPSLDGTTTTWQKGLYWLHSLNPVSHYIYAIDDLISRGTFSVDAGFIISVIMSFLVFFIGWRFFHICEPLLAERL